jgi:hypothetical protein
MEKVEKRLQHATWFLIVFISGFVSTNPETPFIPGFVVSENPETLGGR